MGDDATCAVSPPEAREAVTRIIRTRRRRPATSAAHLRKASGPTYRVTSAGYEAVWRKGRACGKVARDYLAPDSGDEQGDLMRFAPLTALATLALTFLTSRQNSSSSKSTSYSS